MSFMIILSAMTFFEFYDPFQSTTPITKWFLNIVLNIFCVISVALYIYSIQIEGEYLKFTNQLSERSNPFEIYGYLNIFIISLLLLISPIYSLTEKEIYTKESYYDGSDRLYYGRQVHEYIIVTNIIVHFFNATNLLLLINYWGNPSVMRIAKMSGVSHDTMFILKSLLVEYPETFSVGIMVCLLFLYSVVIRILETGIQRSFKTSDFDTKELFNENLVNFGNFDNYKNCIWNMFISMSTIGYGEMNVQATISRFLMFLIILSGLCITALMVTAYSNFFELEKLQEFTLELFDALELKIRMRRNVSLAIQYWQLMLQAAKRESYIHYKSNRNMFIKYIDAYKLLKGLYHSRYGNSDLDVLGISLIKIDDVLDEILKEVYERNKRANDVY